MNGSVTPWKRRAILMTAVALTAGFLASPAIAPCTPTYYAGEGPIKIYAGGEVQNQYTASVAFIHNCEGGENADEALGTFFIGSVRYYFEVTESGDNGQVTCHYGPDGGDPTASGNDGDVDVDAASGEFECNTGPQPNSGCGQAAPLRIFCGKLSVDVVLV